MEIWKEINWIKGFEGKYEISNYGRVKNVNTGKIRKGSKNNLGYMQVGLSKYPLYKTVKVHRLVAEAFLKNEKGFNIINHKDGNKQNNHYENLEWCSSSYNNSHAYKTGLKKIHENRRNSKLTKEKADFIRKEYSKGDKSLNYFAKIFGVNHKTIKSVIENKTFKNYKE